MAYKTIIEVSKDRNNLNRIEESLFYETFVGTIADYVDTPDEENSNDARLFFLKILTNASKHIEAIGNSFTLKNGFKEDYFRSRFEQLKTQVADMSIEDFVDDMTRYSLSQKIEQVYDTYVFIDNDYYETLDRFIRNAQYNTTYWVGDTIFYHV